MRAYLAIVRVGLRQALGGKRLLALGLLGVIPALVMVGASANLTSDAAMTRFHEAPFGILFIMVLPVCALVIGSGAMGDERRDGTLSFLILRPIPRTIVVAAKLTAAWLAATAVIAVSGVLAALVLGLRSGSYQVLFPLVVALAISTAAYTSVFMLLGHLTSRAVLIGLVYAFIWESSITFAAAALANVSLFRIGISAYVAMIPSTRPQLADVLGSLTPGTGGAVIKAVAICLIAVMALAWLLRRRDTVSE
jgi:ABC-2 type transport system permease protein